jgi:hypothetical protein
MDNTVPFNPVSNYLANGGRSPMGVINSIGQDMVDRPDPYLLAAKLLDLRSQRSNDSGFGSEVLKTMQNMRQGQLAGQGIAGAQNPQQPVQGKPKSITTTHKIEMMDTNGDGVGDTPIQAGGPFKVNPALDPRAQMLSAGPTATPVQGSLPNFSEGTGASNVATSVSNQPVATNLSTRDYGNLGWMGGAGTAVDVAKAVAANRLANRGYDITQENNVATQEHNKEVSRNTREHNIATAEIERAKLGPLTTQADAALIKANTDAAEYGLKREGFSTEQELKQSQISENKAKAADLRDKANMLGTYAVDYHTAMERAKASAGEEAKTLEIERAASAMDTVKITDPLLLQRGIKTYGQLLRITRGTASPVIDAAIMAGGQRYAAERAAGAEELKAWGTVSTIAQQALTPFEKLVEPLKPGDPMQTLRSMEVASGKVKENTPENRQARAFYIAQRDLALNKISSIADKDKAAGRKGPSAATKTIVPEKAPPFKATHRLKTGEEVMVVGNTVWHKDGKSEPLTE